MIVAKDLQGAGKASEWVVLNFNLKEGIMGYGNDWIQSQRPANTKESLSNSNFIICAIQNVSMGLSVHLKKH